MNLLDFGFTPVGAWSSDPHLKSGVRFKLSALEDERVIYAFSVDRNVKYIGVCDNTGTTLKDRLNRYQGMMGAGTNKRVAGLVRQQLADGRAVTILALKPNETLELKGLRIDLVKGLENPLIAAIRPEWNIHS